MVKKRLEAINNELSSKVLLSININNKYGSEIAKELDIPQPNIHRELMSLISERYLIAYTKNNNPLNKKIFSIDWDKIGSKFIVFCIDRMINRKDRYYKKFNNMSKNKYIQNLLKITFIQNYNLHKEKRYKIKLIKEIFEDIFMQIVFHLPPYQNISLVEKAEKNRQLRLFLEFTKYLERNVAPYQADIVESFYDDILDTRIDIGTSKKNN